MKLHILSDLHIEYNPYQPVATEAAVVVLAGDIGSSVQGIVWARQAWPDSEIVYVPGNHEYYRSEIGIENELMAQAGKEQGVHVLNRSGVTIGGVHFLGAVLWTDFMLFGEAEWKHAVQAGAAGLTDFSAIDWRAGPFTPLDAVAFNRQDVAWLDASLAREGAPDRTVVVTHHLPSMRSVAARYRDTLLSACFASNLDHMLGRSALWVHGHTHDSFDYVAEGTRVVCNPRGYTRPGRPPENPDFNPGLVVEID